VQHIYTNNLFNRLLAMEVFNRVIKCQSVAKPKRELMRLRLRGDETLEDEKRVSAARRHRNQPNGSEVTH